MEAVEVDKIKKGLEASLAKQLRNNSDEEREGMAHFMESDLHDFIVKYLMPEFRGIYLETKSSTYDELLKRLATTSEAKDADDASGQLFQQGLRLYRTFLKSKLFPSPNLRVEKSKKTSSKSTLTRKDTFIEGAIVQQTIDRRERNCKARDAAIARDECRCRVCGFDFEKTYGPVGKGYIEVHHTEPISNHDDEHEVEIDKLVCLCSNCHAMAHRRRPEPFSINELKHMIENAKTSS